MKCNTPQDEKKNIRIHHHKLERDYSILPNSGVENERLSWAAKGLLWYMISRESTFEIHSWHLASLHKSNKRGGGIDGIRAMLDELKTEGYLVHHKYQNHQGHWEHRYDLYPMPIVDFQKMFPERVKPYVAEPGVVKPDVLPSTELPITELPITKNPPLSSPPKKSPLPKKKPNREEEDIFIHDCLNNTVLSDKEKYRLSRDYSAEQVAKALEIAKTQTIKKTLMHLLLNILDNPGNWPDPQEAKKQSLTPIQQQALEYNEKLRNTKGVGYEINVRPGEKEKRRVLNADLAKQNDTTILEANSMLILLNGFITGVSLKSIDFAKDIKDAIAQLR